VGLQAGQQYVDTHTGNAHQHARVDSIDQNLSPGNQMAFTYLHLAILLPRSSSNVTPEPSSSAAWSAQVLLKNKNKVFSGLSGRPV
jgi:hypothetical protein